jgi:deazaflavin-dependent oxidoreductase (nitroreductase family)
MAGNDWNQSVIDEFRAKAGQGVDRFGDTLLLLHHTGARSGTERVSPLRFTRDGDRYVIVASKGGAPANPDWYHNLRAHPTATVEVGAEAFPVRAAEATGAERDRLFARHAEQFPAFRDYQQKTRRTIPVFVLDRIP